MLSVYVNYPDPKIMAHRIASCSAIRKMRKAEQRILQISIDSLSENLRAFLDGDHAFGSVAETNDMWIEIDLGDDDLERAVLRYVHRVLGKHHLPFARVEPKVHDCPGSA